MARGKEWKQEEVVELLKPFFKLGMSVNKACASAGIPHSTIQTWIKDNNELRLKIKVWQREINKKAYENWNNKILEGDYIATRDWLERREKDEFSTRAEHTGADGEKLEALIVIKDANSKS